MKIVKALPNGVRLIQDVIDCPICKKRKYDDLGVYSQLYGMKICSECAGKLNETNDTKKD